MESDYSWYNNQVNSFHKYWLVFRLTVQDIIAYRFDFLVHVIKYAVMVVMMSLVWTAVQANSTEQIMTTNQTVSYFFMAAMLYTASNFHTFDLEDDIRLGTLSKYLVKPISVNVYYYWFYASGVIIETILKVAIMWPLLWVIGYAVDFSIWRTLIVLLSVPLIYSFALQQFLIISNLTFWISESWAIRWGTLIILRLLAGVLVPISFFPGVFQDVMWWLPFQHLAYTPIQFWIGNFTLGQTLQGFGILSGWLVIFFLFRQWQWRKGLYAYESGGI